MEHQIISHEESIRRIWESCLPHYPRLSKEVLENTPRRLIDAWRELLTPVLFDFKTFDAENYDQMIVEKGIPFYSLCEHHLIPFFGDVAIGYIPDGKIAGLSKLVRTVEYWSKNLNTQEYMTNHIADYLNTELEPKGVGVIVNGRHLCQEMRGIKKRAEMITSALRGVFLEQPEVKEEFIEIWKKE